MARRLTLSQGLFAIEGDGSGKVCAHPHRQSVGDASTEAETHDADLVEWPRTVRHCFS
jgi:hypothetical protein